MADGSKTSATATIASPRTTSKDVKPVRKASARIKALGSIHDNAQAGSGQSSMTELEERVNDLGESWETDSLFEDIMPDITEDRLFIDGAYFSLFCFAVAVATVSFSSNMPSCVERALAVSLVSCT